LVFCFDDFKQDVVHLKYTNFYW